MHVAPTLAFRVKTISFYLFADGTRVIDYTSGESGVDQQSTPPDGIDNPHHQASQEYINGNDLQIKKKEEKINTPV